MEKEQKNKVKVSFSALDPYLSTNIISNDENEVRGQQFISWGDRNMFPEYLWDLYNTVPTLKSIINGVVDFTIGNGVHSNTILMNDEQVEDLVKEIAMSYAIYGGFALNVIRNKFGQVAQINCLNMRNVRSDKKGNFFYYSEDYSKKSYGRGKYIAYPKFRPEEKDVLTSIFYYKNVKGQTYPTPIHGAALLACEMEKHIAEYQLNEISNGFASNVIVSMNNGIPTDEIREEIEQMFNEKFTGFDNAGRPLIVFSQDKEHSVEVEKVNTDDFIDRYESAAKKSRQDIFTAWRANPNIFGIPTENLGFSSEEYEGAFKLFNRTVIRPIQKVISNTLDKIIGIEKTISIDPFSLEENEDENVK